MKRPALILPIMFVAIVGTTALVSTAISGICRSFKGDTEKSIHVKVTPADRHTADEFKQASVKL